MIGAGNWESEPLYKICHIRDTNILVTTGNVVINFIKKFQELEAGAVKEIAIGG